MASQITSLTIVYPTVYSGADRRTQSSASLTFVRGIHRWPVISPHKGPVTRKWLPFDDVIKFADLPAAVLESDSGPVSAVYVLPWCRTQEAPASCSTRKSHRSTSKLHVALALPEEISSGKSCNYIYIYMAIALYSVTEVRLITSQLTLTVNLFIMVHTIPWFRLNPEWQPVVPR